MKLTPAQKVRLGVFLLTGIALLTGSLLVLTGVQVWEPRDHYKVRFTESVAGLEESAQVRYRGLRVGRVDDIRIAPDDPQAIEVTLAIDRDVPLYEGTRAVLDTSGLTGLKTINLTGGDPRGPRIPPGSTLPSDPGLMGRIVDQAESVAENVNRVAIQLARFVTDENRQRVERILVSLDGFLRSADLLMAESREPFGRALEQVGDASAAVTALSREGEVTLRTWREDVSSTLRAVRQPIEKIDPKDVAAAAASARNVFGRLEAQLSKESTDEAFEQLGAALAQLNRLMGDLDLAVRASREDFTASMSYLRQAAEDLREFSRLVAQDPSILLRGRDLRE